MPRLDKMSMGTNQRKDQQQHAAVSHVSLTDPSRQLEQRHDPKPQLPAHTQIQITTQNPSFRPRGHNTGERLRCQKRDRKKESCGPSLLAQMVEWMLSYAFDNSGIQHCSDEGKTWKVTFCAPQIFHTVLRMQMQNSMT